MAKRNAKSLTLVIRREEVAEAGHHGGAWKIAYADFVTAMMAFFLLMWLINATTDAQRVGLADYFAPTHVLGRAATGSGQPFGGRTLNSSDKLVGEAPMTAASVHPPMPVTANLDSEDEEDPEPSPQRPPRQAMRVASTAPGAARNEADAVPTGPRPELGAESGLAFNGDDPDAPGTVPRPGPQPRRDGRAEARREQAQQQLADAAREAMQAEERDSLVHAEQEIRKAVTQDPALADLARQLMIEQVPEGLRIQVIDAEGQPVFANGQAAPNARGRAVLLRAASVIAKLPNPVEITGHTDAVPFSTATDRTNWELSGERAAAVRRLLVENGIAETRIRGVAGRADRELLLPDKPRDAANRRVSVLVVLSQPATTRQTRRDAPTPTRLAARVSLVSGASLVSVEGAMP